MDDALKFIFENYTKGQNFDECWYVFENYLDRDFPHSGERDNFRARLERFENYLKQVLVHESVWRKIYRLDITKNLAELQPLIFRERSQDTSAHKAFSSDYSRFARGQKPKQPLVRLLNLLYAVRCNVQHGQKILPDEWQEIRKRNEIIFSLTTPILRKIDELLITLFVTTGVFAYGTFQTAENDNRFPCPVNRTDGVRIKGHLYNLGDYPAWRYDTWGCVYGCILRPPLQFRLKFIDFCDEVEGNSFERRLVLAYGDDDNPQHIVWVYHYRHEPDLNKRINEGVWKGSNNAPHSQDTFSNL